MFRPFPAPRAPAISNQMDQPVTFAKNFARAAVLATLLVPVAAPAMAGPNETAYLQRLVGTWNGKGKISGEDGGNVTCRLTIKPSGERLNFTGRCALSGGSGSQSFSGRISYDDKQGVYVSSSQGKSVPGKKSGNTLTFATTMSDMRGKGSTTMSLSPGGIKVQFKVTQSRSGEVNQGTIPFTKS
jgi:hypothetical protein